MSQPLTLTFDQVDLGSLALVGGKGANLGELTRAGFPVPGGFCVTTTAYALVAGGAGLEPILEQLAGVRPDDGARLASLAEEIHSHRVALHRVRDLLQDTQQDLERFICPHEGQVSCVDPEALQGDAAVPRALCAGDRRGHGAGAPWRRATGRTLR